MNIIVDIYKDFGIEQEAIIVFFYLKNYKIYNIYNVKPKEIIIIDDYELCNNKWIYGYHIKLKYNDEYKTYIRNQTLANTKLIDEIFDNKDLNIKDIELETIVTNDIARIESQIHKSFFENIIRRFTEKYVFASREVPNNIKYFIEYILKHIGVVDCFIVNICFYIKYLIIIREIFNQYKVTINPFEFLEQIDEYDDVTSKVNNLINECEVYIDKLPCVANLILGKMYDLLGNRSKAKEKFQNAINHDDDYLKYFYYERPIKTYIDEIERYNEFNNDIQMLNLYKFDSELSIVVSVDQLYLRAFGENLIYMNNLLPDIHFHINIITKSKYIAVELFNQILSIHYKISNLMERESDVPTFSFEIIPDFIEDRRTYYACSRYINIEYFMRELNTDIFIMDIDADFITIPYNHFKECRNYDVSIFTCGNVLIFQGRKALAGSVYISNNNRSKAFMRMVKSYILNAFSINGSLWVLDQNALECALQYTINNNLNINIGNSRRMNYKTPIIQYLLRVIKKKNIKIGENNE